MKRGSGAFAWAMSFAVSCHLFIMITGDWKQGVMPSLMCIGFFMRSAAEAMQPEPTPPEVPMVAD